MLEENKVCDNCLECNQCDLNPGKICDNCAKCIDNEAVYEIDDTIMIEELKRKFRLIEEQLGDYKR
jgi:hypothetical protein